MIISRNKKKEGTLRVLDLRSTATVLLFAKDNSTAYILKVLTQNYSRTVDTISLL